MLKEKEVFALGLKRRTNPEFSEELYKSLCAVQDHVTSILRKLGLKSRREILRDLSLLVQSSLLFLGLDGGLDLAGVGECHASDGETAAVVNLDGESAIDQAPDGDVGDLLEPQ